MKHECQTVQEEIAWGKPLDEAHRLHALSCAACSEALARFSELDSLFQDPRPIEIPHGFVDGVMKRILADERAARPLVWALRLRLSAAYAGITIGLGLIFGAELH